MEVNPLSPLPAIVCVVLALATAYLLVMRQGNPITHDRYASLDGLRGYLAFFVFLHHSSIWYFYLRFEQWKLPSSNLYTHFGQSSVALFFMITGFLFFSKLIDGRSMAIDWERLYVSRFLRLVPLYIFAMFIMFLLVAVVSNGVMNEPFAVLAKSAMRWLGFTILGSPDINRVPHTSTLVAGVTWSLPYEWFFYFSLPLLALVVGVKAPLPYILLSIATALFLVLWHPTTHHLASFAGGIAAAFLVRLELFRKFAASGIATLICIGCLVVIVEYYPTAYGNFPLLILSIVFILIACGNTLFGLLIHPVSRMLGEMAYSIYLLHGLMLFAVFNLLIGANKAATYSPMEHWLVVAALTPVLVLSSFVTFQIIESPAMRQAKSATTWMRARLVAVSRNVLPQRY